MKSKENRGFGEDVDSFSGKNGSSYGKDKPASTKEAGLETIIDVTSAVEKYGKEALPAQENFLFWP